MGRDTAAATYVATNRGYFLNYSLKGKVSNRDVDAAFRIRYEDADGSIAVVDTSEYMLDYPYKDVKVHISVLSLESGTILRQTDIQDFDLTLNSILFHPLGQAGIYDYRYSELRSEELVGSLDD